MKRPLAAAAVLGMALGGALWWSGRVEEAVPDPPEERAAVRVSQATIVLRHRGTKQAEIAADRVEVSANRRFTIFTGKTRAVLFQGDVPTVEATGGRIVLDRATQAVRVEAGLTLVTSGGNRLTAQAASWDQESQTVHLVGEVTGTAPPASARQDDPTGLGRLRADRIRYDTRAQVILASGNVRLEAGTMTLSADALRIDTRAQVATAEGRVSVRQDQTTLTAPAVRYEYGTERAEATGGAVLERPDATVRAPQMQFDLRQDVTTASGGVEVSQGDGTLSAPSLRYEGRSGDVFAEGGARLARPGILLSGRRLTANLPAKRAEVRGDVVLVRAAGPMPSPSDRVVGALAREETTVTAGRVVFRWDVNEAEAEDQVVVKQRDKTAWADRMTYSEPGNQLVMVGRVTLEQASGEWLTREGLVAPPSDPKEAQALASMTRLTCSRLTMTLRGRDFVADGPVAVTQKHRSATGDRARYTEATRLLVVTGNVRLQDADGQRLRADRVVISMADETFEAEGDVQTEFVLRPSPSGSPTPSGRPTPTPGR